MSAPIIARLTIRESLGASRGSLHASQSSSATTINAARRRAFVTVSASDAPDKRTTLREESKADNFKLRANDTLVAFTYDAQVRANAVLVARRFCNPTSRVRVSATQREKRKFLARFESRDAALQCCQLMRSFGASVVGDVDVKVSDAFACVFVLVRVVCVVCVVCVTNVVALHSHPQASPIRIRCIRKCRPHSHRPTRKAHCQTTKTHRRRTRRRRRRLQRSRRRRRRRARNRLPTPQRL